MKSFNIVGNGFLILFLTLSSCTTTAQKKEKVYSSDFFGQTIDVIQWGGIEYMCSQSPLAEFKNYRSIFSNHIAGMYNPEAPVDIDKNYKAKWLIRNDTLYLYDVEILDGAKNHSKKFKAIEKLTGKKFLKEICFSDQYPDGAMPASWFSGFICVKRQPAPGETYCDCHYRCKPIKVLCFKDGIFLYEKEESSMEIAVDSVEIYQHPEKYNIYPDRIYRRSPCTNLLAKKLSLRNDQRLWESFFADTNDQFSWDNIRCMCSESPLSVFDHYDNIYPGLNRYEINEALPRFHDKNYMAIWTMTNDTLYLYDIEFQDPQGKKDFDREYPIRFHAVEKLTGKKLRQIPSLNKKGIAADWYSGTLYFKRFPADKEFYLSCKYKCEPFYKIEVEKGKIKSMEKTTYMVVKKGRE